MAHNSPARPRTWTPARGAFGPSAAHAYHAPRIGLRHPMERTGMSQTRTNSRIEAEYRAPHAALGRALRARPQGDPRRPDARQPHPAALSDLRRPCVRPPQVGRRRQRIRRLLRRPRRAAARPRPSGRGGGDRAPGEARHALGRLARAGGAMGRARQSPDPLRRARALHRARAPRPRIWRCGSPAPLQASRR